MLISEALTSAFSLVVYALRRSFLTDRNKRYERNKQFDKFQSPERLTSSAVFRHSIPDPQKRVSLPMRSIKFDERNERNKRYNAINTINAITLLTQ